MIGGYLVILTNELSVALMQRKTSCTVACNVSMRLAPVMTIDNVRPRAAETTRTVPVVVRSSGAKAFLTLLAKDAVGYRIRISLWYIWFQLR